MEQLINIWKSLTLKFTDDINLVEKLWTEIFENYTDKSRFYHNLNHIDCMINKAILYKSHINDFDTILFSIFYHDIIYEVKSNKNEENSADLAVRRLRELYVPEEIIKKCRKQIIATKNHEQCTDNDTNYLVDIDLAILGENAHTYKQYSENIRIEYGMVNDFIYKHGRKKILEHFLTMPKIFKTQIFQSQYEYKARENMTLELSLL